MDLHEPPTDVLEHLFAFAHNPTFMVEYAVGGGGLPLSSAELAEGWRRDKKHWADGIVFPRETCEVPRLRFADLLPLEQIRRFAEANGIGVAMADATLSDADTSLLREVFPDLVVREHPYPDRRVDQVAIVAVEGKHGAATFRGADNKLVTAPLERHTRPDGTPVLGIVFLPTKKQAELLAKIVMRNQETARLAIESYTEGKLRAAMEHDVPIRTYITYSRGVLGRGANLLGIGHLLIDAHAFRAVSGFAAATITPEEFARLRAEERLSLLLQNIGRCFRGEEGKRVVIFILNADVPLIDLLSTCPAVIQGSSRPPIVVQASNLVDAVERADRWLPAGGPWPDPLPSTPNQKRKRGPGRSKTTFADLQARAEKAVEEGISWREFSRMNNLARVLKPEEIVWIKAQFEEPGGTPENNPRNTRREQTDFQHNSIQ